MVTDLGPSTVETVAVRDSVRYSFQRKGFYAKGYHWAFYYASSKIYWRKSADGITWGAATDITPAGETPTEGAEVAVWLDRHEEPAHHPYIIYADHDTDSPIYFRRGTIDDAGDLTWDTDPGDDHAWQTAKPLIVGVSFKDITICVDDANGYPFIGFTETTRADPGTNSTPKVIHSIQMDGTWSTEWTKQLSTTNDTSWVCVVVPAGGPTIMAVYVRDSNQIFYDVYTIGATWTGELGAGVTMGPDATKISVTSQRAGRLAVDTKRVHVAYCDGSENLQHIRIDAFGVVGPTLIYTSADPMAPSISTKIYGGTVNNYRTLYVFWTPVDDEPRADYVCYKKSLDAGANWTKEDGSVGVEEWRDETGAGLSGINVASSYFEEQHHFKVTGGVSLPESYLGILYTNEGASPDSVRWAGLEFADPDEDLLCNANIRHDGTPVELLGKFITQVSLDLPGKTEIRHTETTELLGRLIIKNMNSADLLGKTDIRHTGTPVELLGKTGITHSADLLGRFDVGQGSEDLFSRLEVGQGSQELFAKADIQQETTDELLGKADIRHTGFEEPLGKAVIRRDGVPPVELFGKASITHSADLLGKADIRHLDLEELLGKADIRHDGIPVELFGKALIRHTGISQETLGKALIRHSAYAEIDDAHFIVRHSDFEEFVGRFRTTTDHWIIQGVSVEAYIARSIVQ